jgi:hypothetical protein
MVTTRILYRNVMLIHLLHFGKELADDPSTRLVGCGSQGGLLEIEVAHWNRSERAHVACL